ncbi:MAG: cellulose synthase subunit BcsC-related outer membrane protein [Thermodesulfobacteriota bacterium]|nr:cellulose synthase subunit BcsC-related outer membrane protein [Thermodesulfobacteriota bacterium]
MKQRMLLAAILCVVFIGVLKARETTPSFALAQGVSASDKNEPSVRARATLEIAWWHFREGRHQRALELFEEVFSGTGPLSVRQEAQWGKALCLERLQRPNEAAVLVQDLHRQGYRTREMEKWLREYHRAGSFVRRNLLEARIRQEAALVLKAEDAEKVSEFVHRNQRALRRCVAPEAFFEAARALRQKGNMVEARTLQEKLLECTHHRYDLRLGVYSELLDLVPVDKVLAWLKSEKERAGVPSSYRDGLEALETEALRRKLFTLPETSAETEPLARMILEKKPDDPETLVKLGWHAFHAGRFSEAQALFSRAYNVQPERQDTLLGLAHALISQKKFRQAQQALDSMTPPYSEERREALFRLYMEEGAHQKQETDLPGAEAAYRQAAALNEKDIAPWRSLGWVLLEQGRASEAAKAFERALALAKEREDAEGLLLSLERSGTMGEAFDKAKELTASDDPSLRQAAAGHFERTGKVLHAAQAASKTKKEASPWSTLAITYESRSGDDGTSRLKTLRVPWNVYVPTASASLWTLRVEGLDLDSNDPGKRPYVGSSGLSGPRAFHASRWITSKTLISPSAAFLKEGAWNLRAEVGLTPLEGPVDTLPTFALELSDYAWRFEFHQESVKDSLLSWIGQRDPYSDKTWGRVVRTGGSLAYSRFGSGGTWSSVRVGADHYRGEELWRNFSVSGDVAVGQIYHWKAGTVSVGAFLAATHYDRNSDFYTLGHGGYFSPSIFVMAGPTVRYRTDPDKPWWLDAQASAGYLYYKTDSSPVYPRHDRPEKYSEDRFSGLGYSGSFKSVRLLKPHWAVGMHLDVDKSSDYKRWSAGAAISWFFDARSTLGHTVPHYDVFFESPRR